MHYLNTRALAAILGQTIAAMTEQPRDEILAAVATKAGLNRPVLDQVLAGSPVPLTKEQIEAIAAELSLDPGLLKSAAAEDPEQVRRQERERLSAIDAIALPGHGELVTRLKQSGATVEAAAVEICKAERARLAAQNSTRIKELQMDEASIPGLPPAPTAGAEDDDAALAAAANRVLDGIWAERGLKRPGQN